MNKVMLIGNLTSDPEMRSTENGKKLTSFSIATNRYWKTASGERSRATDFHRIVAWGRLAEICGSYLRKGKGIYLGGRLNNRTFVGRDGKKHYITEIVADELNILSAKGIENSDGGEFEGELAAEETSPVDSQVEQQAAAVI